MSKLWLEFPVYVNIRGQKRTKDTKFYKCFVFRNQEAMHEFLEEQDRIQPAIKNRKGWSGTVACARYFGKWSNHDSRVGVLCFHVGDFGCGVVSHEMVHAAVYATHAGKSFPFRFTKRYDEALAWTVGDMVAQFYRWYWRNEKGIKAMAKAKK